MSINLRILVPESTTNYVLNPSMRYNTTGWNANGSTISRTLDYARFGIASLKVITSGSALNEGTYYRVSSLVGVSSPITVSVYVRGSGNVRLRLIDNPVGQEFISDTVNLDPSRWKRVEISGMIYGVSGGNDVRMYVEADNATPNSITFYVDGAQMELKPYTTTYCDGDQPGCQWNIVKSASVSTRDGDTRQGGRWVDLAGPCRGNDNLYVTVLGGAGMAPMKRQVQSFALAPGSFNQGYKIENRVLTWNFYAKQETISPTPSLSPLHELRQQLIDIIKPDKTLGDESFLLEYSDDNGSMPLYCNFRYEAGLEGQWDIRNGFFNTFSVRMLAVDPFWYEDNQDVKLLGVAENYDFNTSINLWRKRDGQWSPNFSSGMVVPQAGVAAMVSIPDGTVYIGGAFTNDGLGRIAKWDGDNYTVLGAGGANAAVLCIAVAPNGMVYAGGTFTNIGGVACNRVAKYDPSTNTWSALGTGAAAEVDAICVAKNGDVYIGGTFTSVGGINCYRLARWDGLQWNTVGATSGVNSSVFSIVPSLSGDELYVGGGFTTDQGGGVTYNNVAKIDIDTHLLSALGYGLNNTVTTLHVGNDGILYAGGNFTASGSPGSSSISKIAKYTGGNLWFQVGDGLNDQVRCIDFDANENLYAVGDFTFSGSTNAAYMAKLSGGSWIPVDFYTAPLITVFCHPNGDIYTSIGTASPDPSHYSVPKLNIVSNNGSASAYPILYLSGYGTLLYVSNNKTEESIFFYLPILENEEVEIDFSKGTVISTTRGNLLYSIIPGSSIRAVNLIPDDNEVSLYVINSLNFSAQLRWQPQHWSADAIVDASPL